MRVKKYLGIALSIVMALGLAGCGEKFPELTDEQYEQTVEYAAGLLMKHSNNGQERLVYVDAKALEKQRAKEAEAAVKEAEETATQQPAPVAPEPTPAPAAPEPETVGEGDTGEEGQPLTTGDEPVSETAEGEATEEPAAEEATDPNAVTLSDEETQEITDNIFLSYQGYMVSSSYPESSKSYVVNADKGKKLLVLRFDLYNASDSSKQVSIISLNPQFEIIMNGKNLGYSAVTFLPNDLSTFSGTIDSRAHESVVVLTQIKSDDAKNIESLGMVVTMKGQSQTVNLK